MVKKITITGTESTGKTELTNQLAAHYKTIHVPDFSRSYVAHLDRKYNHTDVLQIAKGIIQEEDRMSHYANHQLYFSDNDLINIKIWLKYYKWSVPDWLEQDIEKRKSDLYLLCDIDIPWVADAQRSNEDDRKELFEQFVHELTALNANFKLVKGRSEKRLQHAIEFVDEFINP